MIAAVLGGSAAVCASVLFAARMIALALVRPSEIAPEVVADPPAVEAAPTERFTDADPIPVGGHTPRVRRL